MTANPEITPRVREQPRCCYVIDCAGAQLQVHVRRPATVLRLDGQVDASNADSVADAIRRFSKPQAPLVLDVSHLEFLAVAGLRTLISLNHEYQQAGLHCSVVGGPALRRLTRVVTDHGLPIVDSVAEARQIIEDILRARREFLSGLAGHRSA